MMFSVKGLFFLFLFMAVSAFSASPDTFERPLDDKEWLPIGRVFKPESPGMKGTVSVELKCKTGVKKVVLQNSESNERLCINMNFLEGFGQRWSTGVRYNYNGTDETFVTSDLADASDSTRGLAYAHILTKGENLYSWTPTTPHPEKRPRFSGVLYGDDNAIEITRYLFCGCAEEQGYFIRMVVQYNNLKEMKLVLGQECYGGRQRHGADAAATKVVDEWLIKFKDEW